MPAGIYNTTMEEARDFVRTFTWNDEDGNPVDLTGYTEVAYAVRGELDNVTVLDINSVDDGSMIKIATPATDGIIEITVPAVSIVYVPTQNGRYVHELIVIGGSVTTALLRGQLTFLRSIA